jgi:hypothetical protein
MNWHWALVESNWQGELRYLTYFLTYLITTWRRVLLETLTGSQLVKKFPAFYGTRKFITVFTSACHLSLFWASSIQSIPPQPTSWNFILLLSSTPGSSKWSLSLRFPHQNPVYAPPLLHARYMHRPSYSSWFCHPNKYLVCSTDHHAPHYVVFSIPLSSRLS